MKTYWRVLGTAVGAALGYVFQPLDFLGRPGPWWHYAFPLFGAMIGLALGQIADYYKIR